MTKEQLIKAIKGLIEYTQDCQYGECVTLAAGACVDIDEFQDEDGFLFTEELEEAILKFINEKIN